MAGDEMTDQPVMPWPKSGAFPCCERYDGGVDTIQCKYCENFAAAWDDAYKSRLRAARPLLEKMAEICELEPEHLPDEYELAEWHNITLGDCRAARELLKTWEPPT